MATEFQIIDTDLLYSTPTPVTAYSGRARTTITITGPTPTRTRTTKVYTTVRTTSTVWAAYVSTYLGAQWKTLT